jgi:hypothetical protein
MIDGTSEYIAQGFQLAATATIDRVAVRLKTYAGSPTGNVNIAIFTDATGDPNAAVTGLDFTDFGSLDSSTTTSEYLWYFFTVSAAVSLTLSTQYHLVVRHADAGATGTNTVSLQEVSTPSGYANGHVEESTTGLAASWSGTAAADLNFRIYDGTATITAIADYKLADTTTEYHLVVADGEVYKNVSGTMTPVSTRERQEFTFADTTYPSWAVGNDRWYYTNDTEVSKKFYYLSGTEYWENEGISPPTATISLGVDSGDALADDTYYIDWLYWNDDLGILSDSRYLGADTLSQATVSQHITISSIPATVPREGDRATHIRFYIKKDGTDTKFKYCKQIAIGTTSTTIIDTDYNGRTTEGIYEHAVAPVHKIKCVAENRQFIGNIASHPYRIMFSAVVGITPHYESYPATNYRDFGKGDGDYVTALAFLPPRTLVVGFKNKIYAIDARKPKTSDRYLIADNIGIAHHLAFSVVGGKLFFMSDAEKNKGPFIWEGQGEPRPILGIDDTFKGLIATRMQYASCAQLAPGDNRYQWWTLVTGSGATHDTILVYDYLLGAWAKYKKPAGRHGNVLGEIEESSVGKIYLGGYDGVEYLQDTGSDDAGTSYTAKCALAAFDFGGPDAIKKMRFVRYVAAAKTAGSIGLAVSRDYGTRSQISTSLQHISSTGTFVLGTSTLGSSATLGGASDTTGRSRLRGAAIVFEPELSADTAWHLKGIAFNVQPTGRM